MRALDFLFAARPMLLVPVWTVYLVTLHYHHALSGESFDLLDVVSLLALTLAFAGAYFINQVHDMESDRINNKLGFLQRGYISPSAMTIAFLVVSIASLAIGIAVSFWLAGLIAQVVFLSWAYSAPPFRLKDRPVSGLIANGWAVGLISSVSVMPHQSLDTIGLLGWNNPFYFLVAVVAVTIVTTIPDREGDAATGKRTIAVVLGTRGALFVSLVCLGVAVWTAWQSEYPVLVYVALFGAMVVLMALTIPTPRLILLAAKVPILALTLVACTFYPLYFVFLVALILGTRIYYRKRFALMYPSLS